MLRFTVWILAHLSGGGGDILWHKKNIIDPAAEAGGLGFIKLTFGRDDVVKVLSACASTGWWDSTDASVGAHRRIEFAAPMAHLRLKPTDGPRAA